MTTGLLLETPAGNTSVACIRGHKAIKIFQSAEMQLGWQKLIFWENSMRVYLLSVLLSLCAAAAHAATLSGTQALTVSGQTFNFSEAAPASNGTGGLLTVVVEGDLSCALARFNCTTLESSTVSLGFGSGSVWFGNSAQSNLIISNTVSGLTVVSGTAVEKSANDVTLTMVFQLSGSLLDNEIADGTFDLTIQNSGGVNPSAETDPDFASFSLTYDELGAQVIPLPAGFPLLLAGLGGMALLKRRKKS